MSNREIGITFAFSIIVACIFSGIFPSLLLWAGVIFASGVFLDDLSTFIFVSMDGSVENESNDILREYMRKYGVIMGLILHHCNPRVIGIYIGTMVLVAPFGCLVFFVRSYVGHSASLEVIAVTSFVFVGMFKTMLCTVPNTFGIVERAMIGREKFRRYLKTKS